MKRFLSEGLPLRVGVNQREGEAKKVQRLKGGDFPPREKAESPGTRRRDNLAMLEC